MQKLVAEFVELKGDNTVITDGRGIEYVFEPQAFERKLCKIKRHNMTVDLVRNEAVQPIEYTINYKTDRQKNSRLHGKTKSFPNAIAIVERIFNSQHKMECRKVEDRERAAEVGKEFLSRLKVGTILVSSWGYSMTIVDFYKVKAVKGNKVTLIELQNKYPNDDSGSISSSHVVASDIECGQEKTYTVRGSDCIRINDSSRARIWDGRPMYENRND